MPLIATLIAWTVADVFIYSFSASLFGTDNFGTAARILLSAAVGFTIYAITVSRFASVSVLTERK